MSSKTKIIVLHMKEVVYTAVFLALALILLVVFLIMFSGKKDSAKKPSVTTAASAENARYIPGIYTSTICETDDFYTGNCCCDPLFLRADGRAVVVSCVCGCEADSARKNL